MRSTLSSSVMCTSDLLSPGTSVARTYSLGVSLTSQAAQRRPVSPSSSSMPISSWKSWSSLSARPKGPRSIMAHGLSSMEGSTEERVACDCGQAAGRLDCEPALLILVWEEWGA